MKLLKYLIAIIGILHQADTKAFQTSKNIKGKFDHMYDNVYLKKITDNSKTNSGHNYEIKYLPHVDGKPIFIPSFDELETFTSPSLLKVKPHQLKYKPHAESPKIKVDPKNPAKLEKYSETWTKNTPIMKQKIPELSVEKSAIQPPIQASTPTTRKEYLKKLLETASEEGQANYDHPEVVDVVTNSMFDSNNLNEQDKTVANPLKEISDDYITYESGRYLTNVDAITKKEIHPAKLKYDSKISKNVPKENVPKLSSTDNPGLLKIKSPTQKLESETKSSVESHLKDDEDFVEENSEDESFYYQYYDSPEEAKNEVKKAINEEDYESPVVVEAFVRKTEVDERSKDTHLKRSTEVSQLDDYDIPVVVEAFVRKTEVDERSKDTHLKKSTEVSQLDDIPVVVEAFVKKTPFVQKYPIKHTKNEKLGLLKGPTNDKEMFENKGLIKKNLVKLNKKRIKYSSKLKPQKNSFPSHYDTTIKGKSSSFDFAVQDKISETSVEISENIVTLNPLSLDQRDFSNEDLFDNFEDEGSGIVQERSSHPLLTSFHSQERNKFKKCKTPNEEPGNCLPIQMCPLQLTLDDLMKKICSLDEVFIGICCPEFPVEILKIDWKKNISSNDKEELNKIPGECGQIEEFSKNSQSWPWMAPLITVSTRQIFCGGVLINERYVLTAAHCTRKIPHNQIVVVLGPSEKDQITEEFEVVEIKRHAQYNSRTMQNDLALLKLSKKVPRRFICLPDDDETFIGKEALMLGWQGSFAASKMEEKLLVISPQECRKRGVRVKNIMCTEARTEDVMCNVDSGAPLIIKHNERYRVIGILTWNRNDCDGSFPSIFTSVSHFRGWIENHSS